MTQTTKRRSRMFRISMNTFRRFMFEAWCRGKTEGDSPSMNSHAEYVKLMEVSERDLTKFLDRR